MRPDALTPTLSHRERGLVAFLCFLIRQSVVPSVSNGYNDSESAAHPSFWTTNGAKWAKDTKGLRHTAAFRAFRGLSRVSWSTGLRPRVTSDTNNETGTAAVARRTSLSQILRHLCVLPEIDLPGGRDASRSLSMTTSRRHPVTPSPRLRLLLHARVEGVAQAVAQERERQQRDGHEDGGAEQHPRLAAKGDLAVQ